MFTPSTYNDALLFLGIAVVVLPLCRAIGLSPILGYLLTGVAIGPHGLQVIQKLETTRAMGELGVVFMLFAIGLELPVERLRTMTRYVLGLGTSQMVATGLILGLVGWYLGLPPAVAAIIGGSLAFSSTAFVLQALQERGLIATRLARRSIAVLVLQDMAVVPILIALSVIGAGQNISGAALGLAIGEAVLVAAVILTLGRYALRPLFRAVTAARSPEGFTAVTLFVIIGASVTTEHFGLSDALGAFLVGISLASTEYRHQIEAEIEPYRGLLLGLFFLSVGMVIDLASLREQAGLLAVLVIGVVVIKSVVLGVLAWWFGVAPNLALRLGLLLAQVGEFAFVVLDQARDQRLIPASFYDLLVPVVALSMALTPLMAGVGTRLKKLPLPEEPSADAEWRGHVVIIGMGRVGRMVSELLAASGRAFIGLDHDSRQVAEARRAGLPVVYGDAKRLKVLDKLHLDAAGAVVLTMDSPRAVERVLAVLRKRHPHLTILARAYDVDDRAKLLSAGASSAISGAFEGGLRLGHALLRSLGESDDAASLAVAEARRRYEPHDANTRTKG